jgi:hypothetical protein
LFVRAVHPIVVGIDDVAIAIVQLEERIGQRVSDSGRAERRSDRTQGHGGCVASDDEAADHDVVACLNETARADVGYTAILTGKDNTTGVALIEAYDLDQTVDSQFKRGGLEQQKLSLEEAGDLPTDSAVELLALDDALEGLTKIYPRKSKVVELKFFGGMEAKQISEVLQVSEKTALRDWNFARLWLSRELRKDAA